VRAIYRDLEEVWNGRAQRLNDRLIAAKLPVRVANLSTIWTLYYPQASAYNWMLQYYLRAAGLALSWVGTGRVIFSLNYSEEDFAAVADRIVSAAEEMQRDGWWWSDSRSTNKAIKRRVLKEMLQARWASGWTSPIGSINSPRIK